jgi:hypothetical protein
MAAPKPTAALPEVTLLPAPGPEVKPAPPMPDPDEVTEFPFAASPGVPPAPLPDAAPLPSTNSSPVRDPHAAAMLPAKSAHQSFQ